MTWLITVEATDDVERVEYFVFTRRRFQLSGVKAIVVVKVPPLTLVQNTCDIILHSW